MTRYALFSRWTRVARISATAGILCFAGLSEKVAAASDDVADFYRGKTIRMLISGPPGSGYDTYARLLARHIGAHIPGRPSFTTENMTAAGGLVLLNTVYNTGPFDGTVLYTVHFNLPFYQAIGGSGVRFDIAKMHAIGRLLASNAATGTYAKSAAGVSTYTDALNRKAVIGSAGATSNSTLFPVVLNRMAGTQFKVVPGYDGNPAVFMAMEKGEVDGFGAYSYLTFKSVRPDYLAQNLIRPIVQWGAEREEGWPDTPTAIEVAKTPLDKTVMRIISAGSDIGFSYFVGPGVPQERVTALRTAFQEMLKDPKFLADVAQARLFLREKPGTGVQAMVQDVLSAPRDVIERAIAVTKLDQ